MTMTAPPARTEISDAYPNPTNAVARTGFGKLWDFMTGLNGSTGFLASMLDNSKILDPLALYNISLVPSVAGNALTMKVTSRDGSTALATGNPATISQRSATLSSGIFNSRNITGDITLVISSGSTLGHANNTAGYIYWYLIDNAGTQELAASTKDFGRQGIVTTTAEGGAGAADIATTMYSATARTSVPFRQIGRTIDTQTTAGTWTAVPTTVEVLSTAGFDDTNTWTPTMSFGGGTTGITYGSQAGEYVKCGRLVVISYRVILTSKGSSAGAAAVNGLPYPLKSSAADVVAPVLFAGMTTSYVNVNAVGSNGAAAFGFAGITAAGTGNNTSINDTNWGNGTQIGGTMSYITDR